MLLIVSAVLSSPLDNQQQHDNLLCSRDSCSLSPIGGRRDGHQQEHTDKYECSSHSHFVSQIEGLWDGHLQQQQQQQQHDKSLFFRGSHSLWPIGGRWNGLFESAYWQLCLFQSQWFSLPHCKQERWPFRAAYLQVSSFHLQLFSVAHWIMWSWPFWAAYDKSCCSRDSYSLLFIGNRRDSHSEEQLTSLLSSGAAILSRPLEFFWRSILTRIIIPFAANLSCPLEDWEVAITDHFEQQHDKCDYSSCSCSLSPLEERKLAIFSSILASLLILVTAILSYPLEAGEMASSKFTFDLFELPMKIAGSEEHLAG